MTHHCTPVVESSQTSAARLEARELASRAGFDETDIHRVGLVATELATNLVKHATHGGDLLMRITDGTLVAEVELIAIDRGPGIRDVGRSMADGHSTTGSPGTGLGAVRRLADDFDIFSIADRGTVVLARMRAKHKERPARAALQISAVSVAMPGESRCGDAWSVRHCVNGATVLVADGLGHGVQAAEASDAAVTAFTRGPIGNTVRNLEQIHDALRHTRGAAGAIAEIRKDQQVVRFSGVGNIAAAVCNDHEVRQAVSHNGTLGHQAYKFSEYTYPWKPDSIFVMHSDGLSAKWALEQYPGLSRRDTSTIAAVLYRDFSRSRDDATVVVGREAA